jgi:glycerol-3-phosphate cytidylyltransferase
MTKSTKQKISMKKQIVGYTSGVFDMFHVGHLNILNRAKSLCDRLIVGVTIDELVSYKNAEAVVSFEERLEIVKNIKCVDLAIPQDNLDKFVMWEKLKFDVMFIGDDWFKTERFNEFEEKLARVGVEIIYLPYTKGVSTSVRKKKKQELKN